MAEGWSLHHKARNHAGQESSGDRTLWRHLAFPDGTEKAGADLRRSFQQRDGVASHARYALQVALNHPGPWKSGAMRGAQATGCAKTGGQGAPM